MIIFGIGVGMGWLGYKLEILCLHYCINATSREKDHITLSRAGGRGNTGLTPYPQYACLNGMERRTLSFKLKYLV